MEGLIEAAEDRATWNSLITDKFDTCMPNNHKAEEEWYIDATCGMGKVA